MPLKKERQDFCRSIAFLIANLLLRALQTGIQRIAQAIAEEGERQHYQRYGDRRQQQQPGLRVDGRLAFQHRRTPTGNEEILGVGRGD